MMKNRTKDLTRNMELTLNQKFRIIKRAEAFMNDHYTREQIGTQQWITDFNKIKAKKIKILKDYLKQQFYEGTANSLEAYTRWDLDGDDMIYTEASMNRYWNIEQEPGLLTLFDRYEWTRPTNEEITDLGLDDGEETYIELDGNNGWDIFTDDGNLELKIDLTADYHIERNDDEYSTYLLLHEATIYFEEYDNTKPFLELDYSQFYQVLKTAYREAYTPRNYQSHGITSEEA